MDEDESLMTEGSEDGLNEEVMAEESEDELNEEVMAEGSEVDLDEMEMAEESQDGSGEVVMAEECLLGHSDPCNKSECTKKQGIAVNRDFVALVGDARRLFCVLYGGRQQDLELIHSRYHSRQVQAHVYHFSVPAICLLNELGWMGYRVYNNVGKHLFGWLLCRSHEAKEKGNDHNAIPCQCFSPQETPVPQNRLLATPRRQIKTVTAIN